MRLSCADSSFPKLSRRTALAVISDLAIPGVDLCLFGVPDTSFYSLDEAIDHPAKAAAGALADVEAADLEVADVFAILSADFQFLAVNHPSADDRAESRRRCLALLEYASAVGSPGLTLLPGVPFDGEDRTTSRSRAAEELQWRAEKAAERGIALSIEAHFQSIVETPEETLELLAAAPGLTLALDPSHFFYQGFELADLEPLVPPSRHVQARQAAKGAMQLSLKDGTIDFAAFIRMLQKHGYDAWFGIEYQWEEWLDCYNVDCISETAVMRDLFHETLKA